MDVTVITVAYHSFAVLPQMADSLPTDVPLILVDNGADDGLRGWAAARGTRLIVADRNLGFGVACNLAAAGVQTDLLLFLNPDARLEPDCLAALVAAAGRWPGAAAFGPLLVSPRGRPGFKRRTALAPLDRFAPPGLPDSDAPVPVLSGAAMLVRRRAFEAVGGFDPDLFLYFEDDDLSLRLRRTGADLVLVPAARASHLSGGSTAATPALRRLRGHHFMRSYLVAARKHRLPLPWLTGLAGTLSATLHRRMLTRAGHRGFTTGRYSGLWADLFRRR